MVQIELKLHAWLGRKLGLKYGTQSIRGRATDCQPANLLVLSHFHCLIDGLTYLPQPISQHA